MPRETPRAKTRGESQVAPGPPRISLRLASPDARRRARPSRRIDFGEPQPSPRLGGPLTHAQQLYAGKQPQNGLTTTRITTITSISTGASLNHRYQT